MTLLEQAARQALLNALLTLINEGKRIDFARAIEAKLKEKNT